MSPQKPPGTEGQFAADSEPQLFTLEEAFDYFRIPPEHIDPSSSPRNLERAIRAVTFLLEWLSEHGNEPVDGFAAHGLAQILDRCANELISTRSKLKGDAQ